MNLFKRYKKEQKEAEELKECEHDWEVVEKGDIYSVKNTFMCEFNHLRYETKECYERYQATLINFPYFSSVNHEYHSQSENKVCIKCGECYNGIEIYQKGYDDQEQEKIDAVKDKEDRKEFAKKLWEEKCCN